MTTIYMITKRYKYNILDHVLLQKKTRRFIVLISTRHTMHRTLIFVIEITGLHKI